MKSAVVTGAGGFLGRALVSELRRHGIRVLAVTRTPGQLSDDPGIIEVTPEDGRFDRLAALADETWEVFYHLAWRGSAGAARRDPDLQLACVLDTAQAVQAAKDLGCGLFIGAGSIMEREIFAACAEPSARPGGAHIYSAAKLAAHQMSRCLASDLGLGHIWAVITNAYGEGEGKNSPRLVNATLRKLLRGETPRFTQATQYYDFLHVEDAARAFRLLGERGKPFHEYTLGSGGARPLRDYLETLCRIATPDIEPVFGALPSGGASLPPEAFDASALMRDTGFLPQISFEEGISRTLAWLKEETNPWA